MNRLLARFCDLCAWLHRFFAKWGGGTIARVWRWQARRPLAPKLFLGYLLLGLSAYWIHWFVPAGFADWAAFTEAQTKLFGDTGGLAAGMRIHWIALVAAGLCALSALVCWLRTKLSFRILEAAWAAWAGTCILALHWAFTAPSAMVAVDYKVFDKLSCQAIWTAALGVAIPFAFLGFFVLLGMLMASTRAHFERRDVGVLVGDRFVESVRTGGSDPRYRTSSYWAAGLFLFVLILPFLINGCGWEEPYGLVKGSGEPEVQVVKIKKIKKEKKKKFILNAWSPYIFERVKIDDLKTFDEMMTETQDTYVAESTNAKGGKLGKGGGKTGGWPKGMENAKVRFIRLEYKGGDWDQDMGKGSDYNLLLRFHAITGFPIASETESKTADRLRRFPKNFAPPFIFLTGSGNINFSQSEIETLRWYLTDEGGMLFIDNGGGHFGNSVRTLISRIFPGQSMIDISNDDDIFRQPYTFPDGAPPFWHHDGNRAKGIRVGDRLAVFYHPGDVNDAWKDGHSGASKEVAEQAYQLGVNVMYYAFNAYYARHFESDGSEKK